MRTCSTPTVYRYYINVGKYHIMCKILRPVVEQGGKRIFGKVRGGMKGDFKRSDKPLLNKTKINPPTKYL